MNALKPRPPFQVLVMMRSRAGSGASRSRRRASLKQIIDAGVRVFFYLEDRECTLERGDRQDHALAHDRSPTRWNARKRGNARTTR